MTYIDTIEKSLLSGKVLSYRVMETEFAINHPGKPLFAAIERLKLKGINIDKDGYPRINVNTGKLYKVWYIKGELK